MALPPAPHSHIPTRVLLPFLHLHSTLFTQPQLSQACQLSIVTHSLIHSFTYSFLHSFTY